MAVVVFAYHNVGVRCLSVLLAHGADIALVVTHRDSPTENIWFESVAELAQLHHLPVLISDERNHQQVQSRVADIRPDHIFSFYYRFMLDPAMLAMAEGGAFNMHGSLLPKYRGRVPVNWAVINGETETGVTLHLMEAKPDAGDIVDQQAVAILPDDTAFDVFQKITCAAEAVLHRALPTIMDGSFARRPQMLAQGSYFGGRKPQDGRIDWRQSAETVHNLIRGVAPPYPGAFGQVGGMELGFARSVRVASTGPTFDAPTLFWQDGDSYVQCGDGGVLRIGQFIVDGRVLPAKDLAQRLHKNAYPLI